MADATPTLNKAQLKAMNEERKFLETLLKERFNFFLVSAPIFLFGVSKASLNDTQRLWALAFGFGVFLLATLSIVRTHILINRALNLLLKDETQAYYIITKKRCFLPRANVMLVCICFVITGLMLILVITAITDSPMRMGSPIP